MAGAGPAASAAVLEARTCGVTRRSSGRVAVVARAAHGVWTLNESISRSFVVSVAAAVAGTVAWTIFHSTRGARWYFAGGLLIAALGLLGR